MKATNNKGFTLVELLVTLAISSIVLTVAGGILLSSFQLFSHSTSINEAKMIGDTVNKYLSDQLTYVAGLQLVEENDSSTIPQYDNKIQVMDGKLYSQTASQPLSNIFGDKFYMDTTICMTVTTVNQHMIAVKIEVLKKGNVLYQTSSMINLLNIELKKGSISGKTGSELSNPQLIFSKITNVKS